MVFVGHWSVAQPQVHHKHWETTEHAAGEGHVFSPESQGWSLSIDQMCRPWRIVFYRVTILAKHMEECTIQSWVNRFGGGQTFPLHGLQCLQSLLKPGEADGINMDQQMSR